MRIRHRGDVARGPGHCLVGSFNSTIRNTMNCPDVLLWGQMAARDTEVDVTFLIAFNLGAVTEHIEHWVIGEWDLAGKSTEGVA